MTLVVKTEILIGLGCLSKGEIIVGDSSRLSIVIFNTVGGIYHSLTEVPFQVRQNSQKLRQCFISGDQRSNIII